MNDKLSYGFEVFFFVKVLFLTSSKSTNIGMKEVVEWNTFQCFCLVFTNTSGIA